jgi:hypothetical protein
MSAGFLLAATAAATPYRLNRLRSAFLARLIQQFAQRRELFGYVGVLGKDRLVRGGLRCPASHVADEMDRRSAASAWKS